MQEIYDLGEQDFAIIINSLLNRIPILISSDDNNIDADTYGSRLGSVISFRKIIIFSKDFATIDEHRNFIEQEKQNLEVIRKIYLCPSEVIKSAFQNFENFQSWIICINNYSQEDENLLKFAQDEMTKRREAYLLIELNADKLTTKIYGKEINPNDLRFERQIYQNSIKTASDSIINIQRIFAQVIPEFSFDDDSELNFSIEEKNIKQNMFQMNLLEFYNAAQRAHSIFEKISFLKFKNIKVDLNEKKIMDIIAYKNISYAKLNEFIQAEWGKLGSGLETKDYNKLDLDLISTFFSC